MGKGPVIWAESGGSPVGKVIAAGGLVDIDGNPIGGSSSPTTTRGDLIYRGAAADDRLAIGAAGQFLRSDGTDPQWFDPVSRFEISLQEDFINLNTTAMRLYYGASGGSVQYSDATAAVPSNVHPGVWKRLLGTSVGQYSCLSPSQNGMFTPLGNGVCVAEWILWLSHLSDGTDSFTLRAGLGNQPNSSADSTDGAYFYYTHSNNSGQWSVRCVNNSSATQTDSASAVAAQTWYVLTVVVNAAGTSVEFFVNGTSIGTVTTNIPTAYPRIVAPWYQEVRTAGSTAGRYIIKDYVGFYKRITR